MYLYLAGHRAVHMRNKASAGISHARNAGEACTARITPDQAPARIPSPEVLGGTIAAPA